MKPTRVVTSRTHAAPKSLTRTIFELDYMNPLFTAAAMLILAAAIAVVVLTLGMVQFPAEDGGIVSMAGWQLHVGARPYIDLPAEGMPPLFLLGAKWAFDVSGVAWSSLVTATAIFAALAYAGLCTILLRLRAGTTFSLALPAVVLSVSMVSASFWWSNQLTAACAALFLAAALYFVQYPDDRDAKVAFVLTAVVLSWAKANSAGLLLVGAAIVLAMTPRLRRRGLCLIAGAATSSIVLLMLAGVDVTAMIRSYLVGGTRVLSAGNFRTFFLLNDADEARLTLSLLLPAAASFAGGLVVLARRAPRRKVSPAVMLCALGVLTGLVAMGTNNDHNMAEVPVILTAVTGIILLTRPYVQGQVERVLLPSLLVVSLVCFGTAGVTYAVDRHRIRSAGPGCFYEDSALTRFQDPLFLRGLQAGPTMTAAADELATVLEGNDWEGQLDAPVYFGPRLLWAYPAFGVRAAPGLPLWWQPYPQGAPRTDAAIAAFYQADYRLMIFYRGDTTFMPPALINQLAAECTVYQWRNLLLCVPRDGGLQPWLPTDVMQLN
ncbi:MAG: hypothetical protein Q7J82_02365 [Coriobacteriia bacterium]|nr:hypothetical protein [Coriobacteriia bacterium]